GHHGGIKDYLEKGQKQDREFERDDMDERVILAGDLDLTHSIIESMDTDAERYLTVTLSFKEDEVSREVLQEVAREFEAFAFSAYRRDEYAFYAEAHVPRIKSYADRRSGELVERKAHVHVVIPETNLLTGQRLEPFGKVDRNSRYIDAFQEHINAKYGLASPKDNRRVQFTDASEMISRYKGDIFQPMNRELKAQILEAVMSGNVTRYDDFQALLAGFGEIRTRNAGRDDAYENVKPPGADKGVNLKEFVFSREFIELDADGKREALQHNVHAEYVEPGVPRATPRAYLDALAEWHGGRAREIKYLNSGSSFYKTYQAASPEEQRRILDHREQRFYDAAGEHDERARRNDGERGYGDWRDPWHGRAPLAPGQEGHGQQWQEREAAQHEIPGRWRHGADHDFDARFDRPRTPAGSAHSVRGVPGRGVDGDAARRQMLLPSDALLELGNQQAHRIDALRWTGDRGGAGREQPGLDARWRAGADRDFDAGHDYTMPYAGDPWPDAPAGGVLLLDAIAARMYAAWDTADTSGRARLTATAADKFHSAGGPFGRRQAHGEPFGLSPAFGGGQLPSGFGPRDAIRSLADVQSLDAIGSLPFDAPAPAGRDAPAGPFNARARAATGREADTVRDQFARDLAESRATHRAREREEFAQIRVTLDATRLLAALAHSHGLIVEKYSVGKGADGGDRIRAGSRNLNVSDFLTREMALSWEDAAQLLRETYRAQTGLSPEHAPRRTPGRDLWGEFLQWRSAFREDLRRAWEDQTQQEKDRRGTIKSTFYDVRSAFADRADLSSRERRERLSAARVMRLEAEADLRERIRRERAALKGAARRPISEQYQDFLQERAQAGDERALHELRRMQQLRLRSQRAEAERSLTFAAPQDGAHGSTHLHNEILWHGPSITYEVQASGEVEYRKDGAALLVDEGRSLRLWDSERDAIGIALRFAQQKFGSTLSLSGPEAFQAAAARLAADLRMHIAFEQPETERMRQIRLAELDADAQERRAAQRERDAWEREQLRDAVRNPPPAPDPDMTPPDEPDVPDGEPEPER
ncbi:MAG TPA: LPD7 domain-containing protein, partial [Paraburkholderia sp.]|nr:LPD7 domain-containing protein [Paraburkholderia sp.]